jgi:enamine deaminase RidA (YjgF/YER057c/UK114 family)
MDVRPNKGQHFTINRNFNPKLTLKRGNTYYFDQSLETNAGFPLRFSTSKDGAHRGGEEYREGVAVKGVPGKRGSYVRITVADNAPDQLYLYCSGQLGMAGESILVIED